MMESQFYLIFDTADEWVSPRESRTMMKGLAPSGSSFCCTLRFSSKFLVLVEDMTMPGLQTMTTYQCDL